MTGIHSFLQTEKSKHGPKPYIRFAFHKLGLMGKRLKGAMFPQLQILQIPSEADKIASLALSKR